MRSGWYRIGNGSALRTMLAQALAWATRHRNDPLAPDSAGHNAQFGGQIRFDGHWIAWTGVSTDRLRLTPVPIESVPAALRR